MTYKIDLESLNKQHPYTTDKLGFCQAVVNEFAKIHGTKSLRCELGDCKTIGAYDYRVIKHSLFISDGYIILDKNANLSMGAAAFVIGHEYGHFLLSKKQRLMNILKSLGVAAILYGLLFKLTQPNPAIKALCSLPALIVGTCIYYYLQNKTLHNPQQEMIADEISISALGHAQHGIGLLEELEKRGYTNNKNDPTLSERTSNLRSKFPN